MKTVIRNINRLGMIFGLAVIVILSSCTAGQKAVYNGDYDLAINQLKRKLDNKKVKDKHILLFEKAYAEALESDLSSIDRLKKQGNPANHKNILNTYKSIQKRQNTVKPYLPLYINTEGRYAIVEVLNINSELAEYKTKTADYLYAKAAKLMSHNNKRDARAAYNMYDDLTKIFPGYKDVNRKKQLAKTAGTDYVKFNTEIRQGLFLPPTLEWDIKQFSTSHLNRKWTVFHNNVKQGIDYNYEVVLDINNIIASPELINTNTYRDEKRVKDGFDYYKDPKTGHYLLDSLGNKTKIQKYKVVYADIVETTVRKEAQLAGYVNFIDLSSNRRLGRKPVNAVAIFENCVARANGDLRALSSESKRKIKNPVIPFPNDYELVLQAGETLKPVVADIIDDHFYLVTR